MSTTELRAHSTVVELGACLIVLLPGAALIDLREMEEASSLFESLERIRDALSESDGSGKSATPRSGKSAASRKGGDA